MTVPYTFGTLTGTIPLNYLDSNFNSCVQYSSGSDATIAGTMNAANFIGPGSGFTVGGASPTGRFVMYPTAGYAAYFYSATEIMRIDGVNQTMQIGTTALNIGKLNVAGYQTGGFYGIACRASGTTGQPMTYQNSSGGTVGSIDTTNTSTSFVTSSDYRLKENVKPMQNALNTIAQLNPVTYTWKIDGSSGQGFIAHELQSVVPECVTGNKDAVDKNGNPVYQGVDTSFLVATLCKAIQEQQNTIDLLTQRIEKLEASQ